MKWSDKKPKSDGYYWAKIQGIDEPSIITISDGFIYTTSGLSAPDNYIFGPKIEPPTDNQNKISKLRLVDPLKDKQQGSTKKPESEAKLRALSRELKEKAKTEKKNGSINAAIAYMEIAGEILNIVSDEVLARTL